MPLLALLFCGCAFLLHVDGGPAAAVDTKGQTEAQGVLETHTALAIHDMGVGVNLRSRAGARGVELAGGPEFCWIPAAHTSAPFVCGGASLLTLGWRDDSFSIGGMSPYLQPAWAFPIDETCVSSIFVSVPVGWDVRFTDQPDSFFAGLTVGYGWQAKSSALKRPCRPLGNGGG